MANPIAKPPANLRQRARADGSVRIWWEPSAAAAKLGFKPIELDAARLTWSLREATRLNRALERAKRSGLRDDDAPHGRSIAALIDKYTRADMFARLAPKTQDSYRKQFKLIGDKWGSYAAADFSKPIMHEWYETLLANTSATTASARLRHFSLLMSYAELIGWRAEGSNPCMRLKMRTPKGRRRVLAWSELDALLAACADLSLPGMATAIMLGLYQGQRQTDLRLATVGAFARRTVQLMGWPAPREIWVWQFTRSKRGNAGALPIHDEATPHLEAALTAAKARALKGGPIGADVLAAQALIWDDLANLPFTGKGAEDRFQNRWGKIRAHAAAALRRAVQPEAATALEALQFRDLRRSFGVLSRAGGASKDDTADVLGNSAATDQLLADIYMAPSFETASRAVLAMQRPEKGKERKEARNG